MSIRDPNQLLTEWDARLMKKPDSNIHVIISKYSDEGHAWSDYNRPDGQFDHIESIATQYTEIQHYNPEWKLPNLKRIYVKTIEDARKLLAGINPYALSFLDHCHFDKIQQGDESWLPIDELSNFINSNQGNVWMVWISGCKSWHFGNNLQCKTNKILMMDARHRNSPEEGFEFYDGSNDEERRLLGMETTRNWRHIFSKTYNEKLKQSSNFDFFSWAITIAINSGVSPEVIQNYIENMQGAPCSCLHPHG